MGDPKAMPDLKWPTAEASALEARAKTLASLLETQAGPRQSAATSAKADWKGAYRDQFDTRFATNARNAQTLAANLRGMAKALADTATYVQQENNKRAKAREDSKSWLEKAGDNVANFLGF